MAIWSQRFYIILYIFLSFSLQAQIENKKKSFNAEKALNNKHDSRIIALYNLYNQGEEKKAYKKAHLLLKSKLNDRARANTDLLIAYYFNKRAEIDSSIYYTNQSLKYNTISNDSLRNRLFALACNLLAINSNKRGLFNESKKWHLEGIEAAQKFKEQNLFYTHIHGLAQTYTELADYQNALKLFKQCITYKDDKEIILGSYINIGDIYSILKDYESANLYYQKGQELCEKTNNFQGKAVILIGRANNYQLQNKYPEALKMFQEALLIADKNEMNQLAVTSRSSIGECYISLQKYNDAKLAFYQALQKAVKFGLLQNQIKIYNQLKEIAIKQEDYKNAYLFFEKSTHLKDSISKTERIKEINELEVKYKIAQKQKEIESLKFENEAKKLTLASQQDAIKNMLLQEEISKKDTENTILLYQNSSNQKRHQISLLQKDQQLKNIELRQQKKIKLFTISAFLILLIPIIALLFQFYKRFKVQHLLHIKQREINSERINSILKEQELELIKASISGQDKERQRISQELHDSIGGNLAAIKLQVNHLKSSNFSNINTINQQLDETYQQVRNLSHTLLPQKLSQNNFLEILQSYLNNISEASKIKITCISHPKKEINELDESILVEVFKIVQELLTNTIKHAKASEIEVQLNYIENIFNLLFEDNGIGFDAENALKGIGLVNIVNRINKLNGTVSIDSKLKRGTIFNIEIPILPLKLKPQVKGIDIKNQLHVLKSK